MSAALWMAGGIFLLVVAAIGFGIALVSRIDQLVLHLTTTLPTIMGIGLIYGSFLTNRTPSEVAIGPAGIRVESHRGSESYSWSQVGWSNVEAAPMNSRRLLKVYDTSGGPIVRLSDAIDGFDELADSVAAAIAGRGDDTASRIQTTKAKRSAVFMAVAGVGFLALAISVAGMTRAGLRAEELLKTSAVMGNGTIERRFIAPNGVTRRLEYRVTTPDGKSATRNAEVERSYWESLEGVKSVPILTVPNEPGISRLVMGELPERDSFKNPIIGYGLPAIVAAMSLLFLVASALMWRGWDIDIDSKTGKIAIKRFGTGR